MRKQNVQPKPSFQSKTNLFLVIGAGAIVLLSLALFLVLRAGTSTTTSSVTTPLASGDAQILRTAVTSQGYQPATITAQEGKPIQFIVDGTKATGCYRSIVSRQLGFSRTLQTGENVFEIGPLQKGTYEFSCSMGMIRGQIVVVAAGEDAKAAVAAPIAQEVGGSCGSGGCGCAGMNPV